MRVSGIAYGAIDSLQWGQKPRGIDFFDIKGDVDALLAPRQATFEAAIHPAMHPGRCARVLVDGIPIGHVGELHPRWRQAWDLSHAPMMFELELDAVLQRVVPQFKDVSRHQAVERDLAVIVADKVTSAELLSAVWAAPSGGVLRDVVLFDVYREKAAKVLEPAAMASSALAPGEKSLAVRLRMNNDEATLTEAEIQSAIQAVVDALARNLGARLRG
jgi:phenylalanyl-tRNA synthetase beta chain